MGQACTSERAIEPESQVPALEKQIEELTQRNEQKDSEMETVKQAMAANAQDSDFLAEFSNFLKNGEFTTAEEIDAKTDELSAEFGVVGTAILTIAENMATVAKVTLEQQVEMQTELEDSQSTFVSLRKLKKLRKGGKKDAAEKFVLFSHVNGETILDWSDDKIDESRVIVQSLSTNESLVKKELTEDERSRFIVIQGETRNVMFLASSPEEREEIMAEYGQFVTDYHKEEAGPGLDGFPELIQRKSSSGGPLFKRGDVIRITSAFESDNVRGPKVEFIAGAEWVVEQKTKHGQLIVNTMDKHYESKKPWIKKPNYDNIVLVRAGQ